MPAPAAAPAPAPVLAKAPAASPSPGPTTLEGFLEAIGLVKHLQCMVDAGYDDVMDFANMDGVERLTCSAALQKAGVPPGHVGKIMRAMSVPVATGQKRAADTPPAEAGPKRAAVEVPAVGAAPAAAPEVAVANAPATAATKQGTDAAPGCRIYVSKLKPAATEELIKQLFVTCGRVTAIDLAKHPETGRCRGACFLTFESATEANAALAMDGSEVCGKAARVQLAI